MAALVYIALGANLVDPKATLQTAIARLAQLPNTHLLQQSSLYQTSPLGPANQPDFINAVVLVKTALSPLSLLDALQALEGELGRVLTERWGPRMIDLDILLYGDQVINSDRLTLPHPGIYYREFVLYPLAEIAPDWILPTGQTVSQLKASCDPRGIKPCQP
jgi:2-amino-4-hydroxy-6-hydroxymethyldihydropteridine diphosphokinase